jgi:hypothetical protein
MGGALRKSGVLVVLLAFGARTAGAWPAELVLAMLRDARRLVPQSLARLIGDRESLILDDTQHFPPALAQAVARDLAAGELQPETLQALQQETGAAVDLLRHQRVTEGLIRLGATLRIPADLSDPALTAGKEGYPPGLVSEYYAFIEANLTKIPVVLDEADALKLKDTDLPVYWQSLLARSQTQSPVLRTELFQRGRVVDHRTIDFRSPVFGVASLSYSRAVTGIAATWLALWRKAHGDVTRMRSPREIDPQEAGPSPLPHEASR